MLSRSEIARRKGLAWPVRKTEAIDRVQRPKLRPEYVDMNTGEVFCKLDGTPLRVNQIVNGRMQTVETSAYTEITIIMNDGTNHETCLCRKCGYNLTDEEAELVYLLDVDQWEKEEKMYGVKNSAFVKAMQKRVPVNKRPFTRRDMPASMRPQMTREN